MKRHIGDERKSRQGQLGANELRQHLVQIAQHAFQKFALRTGMHKREQDFAERASVLEKECRQNRHDDQQPGLLGNIGHAQADALSQAKKVIPMVGQKRRQLHSGRYAPALLLADLFGNLAGTDGFQKLGQGLAQTLRLARDLRSDEKEKGDQQGHEQQINHGDRPSPSAHPFFDSRDRGVHQIGKENRKQEGDQSAAGNVQKAERQREQQHREEDPRRACVNQGH